MRDSPGRFEASPNGGARGAPAESPTVSKSADEADEPGRRPRAPSRLRENAAAPEADGVGSATPTPLARGGREDTSKFDDAFDVDRLDTSNHGAGHVDTALPAVGAAVGGGASTAQATPVEQVAAEPVLDLTEVSGGGGAVPGAGGAQQAT